MAGWSAAYDAVFAKYGFIVSNDLDEAVTIAAILTTNPLPKGDRVAVLTVSVAPASGARTRCRCKASGCRSFRRRSRRKSKNCCRPMGAAGNPIDVTAQGVHSGGLPEQHRPARCVDEVDAVLVVLSLSSDTRVPFKQAS